MEKARETLIQLGVAFRYRSECLLLMGRIEEAMRVAQEALAYEDRCGINTYQVATRTILGSAFHMAGNPKEALTWFNAAEQLQHELAPILYSIRGFRFCDFLLDCGRAHAVEKRARKMWHYATDSRWQKKLQGLGRVDAGLSRVLWGAALGHRGKVDSASRYLAEGIEILREAQRTEYLLAGLLFQADFLLSINRPKTAKPALDEVASEARHDEMWRLETDCKILAARCAMAVNERKKAKTLIREVRDVVEQMGYWRRKEMLRQLERKLA